MNKKDIVEAIHQRIGFSKRETSAIVEAGFDLLKTALAEGDTVMITGFGRFSVREKKARRGRNPQTGESITIPGRKVVTFKASRVLKGRISEAYRERYTKQAVLQDR